MAQSLVQKRRNLATNTIIHATQLWDAFQRLLDLKLERDNMEDGNWVQTDFDGTDLEHLTPAMIGGLYDFVLTDLTTWFNDGTHPERIDRITQVRK
jgi:hypothetical protein